ncbi:MAG: 4Fe-4S cluster-binding domain-containing protein [Candidatus Pacearchaeota archaeon]|nr:4Fe-4S cluster-binding domain-containing protein [Candidatus Pacearchaeota archaeon]
MTIKRTPFASYCLNSINNIAEGCKYCVKGKKLVLFISGFCSRACFYCSLSSKRKNKDAVWANERECKNIGDMLEEAKESRAKGAGITGGDPILCLKRTLRYARALKRTFSKAFHIHIYLPTKLVTGNKLKKLSKYVDEVRFHPLFLTNNIEDIRKEIKKIKLALEFWPKENIGIELPLIPDRFVETIRIIRATSPFIGFVNLNEFEISDTNFDYVTKHYKLNPDTYTVKGSKETGLKIMKELKNSQLKVHLCTARTKNFYQYRNRLKLHKILPFGFKTSQGTVRYFVIYFKDLKGNKKEIKRFKKFKQIYIDKKNKRVVLSEGIVPKLLKLRYKVARVEELPTWDSTIISLEYLL